MIVDLFAGPGGWSEGLRSIGLDCVGLEIDVDSCRTRAAAGHQTIRCDVTTYPPEVFDGAEGVIASPPCQAFSMAGTGAGRREIEHLHAAVEACRNGWTAEEREWEDERTPLILEPLRWAWAIKPTWIACEQVPPAMPVWEHMADVLRSWGYDACAVNLSAEQWGVPQTRRRAFLLAHRDVVRPPKPTHQKYRHNEDRGVGCEPDLFGQTLKPWVSMAQALGWGPRTVKWRLCMSNRDNATVRDEDKPAGTLLFGNRMNEVRWVHDRPASTIAGDPRVFDPTDHHKPGGQSEGAVRITLPESAVLQGFPPDYPFQGSQTSKFRQNGNAMPPPWAAAIIEALSRPHQSTDSGCQGDP